MQHKLIRYLPASLTSRLNPLDDPNDVIFPASETSLSSSPDEAEARMQEAYSKGGVIAFGQQMWVEFEREWDEASKSRKPDEGKAGQKDDEGVAAM